jgi:hypothetical protein
LKLPPYPLRMAGRPRIDLFPFAVGALAVPGFAFLSARNGAALVMCGLCLAGLLAGRAAGFSNRALVPLGLGLAVILWFVWIDPLASGPKTSALAHFGGGALVGWALSEFLRTRVAWPYWAALALTAVFGITVLWELGEYLGDRTLGTALAPNRFESAFDIFFGALGGSLTVALAWLFAPRPVRR